MTGRRTPLIEALARALPYVLGAVALGGGCTWGSDPLPSDIEACARDQHPRAGDVGIDAEGRFTLDREPFVPRGIGSYPLLEHAGNGRLDAVGDILAQAVALGRPVVRTNAFLDGTRNPARIREADGTIREEGLVGLDDLLAAAASFGVRLVLVLTDNWGHYGGAPAVVEMVAPGEGLPKDAFWSEPRAVAAQRAYVRRLARRVSTVDGLAYASHPSILAWELVNEARCTDDYWCDGGTLVRWARTMAGAMHDAGASQPIAWGGAGHLGEHGEDLEAIARDGAVDVLTLHVWPFAGHALHVDGRSASERVAVGVTFGADAIRSRAELARRHRMPLLVEELGWRPASGADRDAERALVLGAWLRAAREEGVGALPWMIGEHDRPDYDGLLIRPWADPATHGALRCE